MLKPYASRFISFNSSMQFKEASSAHCPYVLPALQESLLSPWLSASEPYFLRHLISGQLRWSFNYPWVIEGDVPSFDVNLIIDLSNLSGSDIPDSHLFQELWLTDIALKNYCFNHCSFIHSTKIYAHLLCASLLGTKRYGNGPNRENINK